jgi:alpha-L-rhamnosidase
MAEEVENDTLAYGTTGVFATKVIQTEKYICKGSGTEIWEPRFTYHGFRYVEVSGLKTAPTKDLLTGVVVHSSMLTAGNFNCSNPQINKLHQLSYWTLISNLHSIPTDCPAREKCGWLGDAHAMAGSTIYNMDMENFWLKFMDDIHSTAKPTLNTIRYTGLKEPRIEKYLKPVGIPTMVAPGKRFIGSASPDWGTAIVQLPWFLYQYYGNTDALKKFYPDMKQWVNFVGDLAKNHIVYIGLGDWCPPGTNDLMDCPVPLSSTAFHYNDLMILKQVATTLGYTLDSQNFSDSALLIRNAFISKYYDVATHSFGSHTANAMALDFGLVPIGEETLVANAIVTTSNEKFGGFMFAGIFGLQRLFDQLSKHNNEQAAFNMLDKKGENSFELMWEKYKATTLWEVLPVSMRFVNEKPTIKNSRSHSHPMQAGFDAWFFNGIAGINPDVNAPGFKKIILEPKLINQLQFSKGDYNSVYGTIVSDWKWEGKSFVWNVEIPVNTTATIKLPNQFKSITINKKQINKIAANINGFSRELSSGKYQLVFH